MSLPASSFLESLYRNRILDVLKYLEHNFSGKWRIFEFRSEGSGYDDSVFLDRVEHFPFPDHNPPPFDLLIQSTGLIHKHITAQADNLAVLHCKAGKGRSGIVVCCYLMRYKNMTSKEAMRLFSKSRMLKGDGITILSQKRYINYFEDWIRHDQLYRPQRAKIQSVKVRNLKDGIIIVVGKYVDNGAKVVPIHTFIPTEKKMKCDGIDYTSIKFIPDQPVIVENDVCMLFFHSKSIDGHIAKAQFWFNIFFEEQKCLHENSLPYSFSLLWQEIDGIGGSNKKVSPLLSRIKITWVNDF